MKLYFAAAAAITLLASAPSHATSVMSGGRSNAQDCAMAAGSSSSLTERSLNNGIVACNAAMKDNLSQTAMAGSLVNRGRSWRPVLIFNAPASRHKTPALTLRKQAHSRPATVV